FMDTSDNYFLGVELDGKWGFMDINGKEILPVKYDLIAYAWAGLDRFSVQLDGKWGMIDGKTGEEMIPIKYDEEIRFDFEQNHTVVESDGKFGIIDTAGREILPVIYDRCYPMNEELTRVILNEKWHLIKNSTNEEIIFPTECVETMYDYGTQDNIFLISCDNVLYFLDKTTYEITASVIFDEHGYIRLTDNYIAIKRNSKWGIINAMGKEILPCKYNLSKVQDKLRKKIKKT
ncbi:MAG: WG repeat-containing protein, partial [Lentimicrobiaceae bacterium]|nr:WG repeat-containing protein [Lentimicrobiaceae bacterium]